MRKQTYFSTLVKQLWKDERFYTSTSKLSFEELQELLEGFFVIAKEKLQEKKNIIIDYFGKFVIREPANPLRKFHDISTGKMVERPQHPRVLFLPSFAVDPRREKDEV